MNIDQLKFNEDIGAYPCPKCGEFEFRSVKIYNKHTEEGHDTGDYECDNPDCEYEASLTKGGELI
jgi:predicted RNA-binding Zn-ribbon protein involved in translation (DUF1610 family)|tara:strand:+ start:2948 stop:3142 length:195 start_codon:yes stop_codon:yes gene_type:complete